MNISKVHTGRNGTPVSSLLQSVTEDSPLEVDEPQSNIISEINSIENSTRAGSRNANNMKLLLPFLQGSKKGPGSGPTPACTPIASASVKKDAKRPMFPSDADEINDIRNPKLFQMDNEQHGNNQRDAQPKLPPPAPSTLVLPSMINNSLKGVVSVQETKSATSSNGISSPNTISHDTSTPRKNSDRFSDTTNQPKSPLALNLKIEEQTSVTLTKGASSAGKGTLAVSEDLKSVDISRFHKLLSMGAPKECVQAKMRQAGIDPALLDQSEGFRSASKEDQKVLKTQNSRTDATLIPASPSSPDLSNGSGIANNNVDITKFRKLLAMGAPMEAVKAKMRQAGVDPMLIEEKNSASDLNKSDKGSNETFNPKTNFTISIPSEANDNKPPSVQDAPSENANVAKFRKLMAMGAPLEAVKAKMQQAGVDPALLDDRPETYSAVSTKVVNTVKNNPDYAKFFKLLSMGAPPDAVKAMMQKAGLDATLLDTPDAEMPKPKVLVKDDPEYVKFFKLLSMGAPAVTVKAKMAMAGLLPDLLDTPDAVVPDKISGSNSLADVKDGCRTCVKPQARPKINLDLVKKPAEVQTTRPFYWQKVSDDGIKGTIWEDLAASKSNNSQFHTMLTDDDLSVLEVDFPAPTRAGPATGGRFSRSQSMNQMLSPVGPGSPLATPRKVFLIDRGRSNNISIIVKQFRISKSALREAIMKLDSEILTLERVQGLLKILPTEEEITLIMGYQGDLSNLNEAEAILRELLTVPRLKQRLISLQSILQFPLMIQDVVKKINKLTTACKEIQASAEFRSVLHVVLQVGNKMNRGSNRGNALGFKLLDLTKLIQLKSSVQKSTTLLHFVARVLRRKNVLMVQLNESLGSLYDVQNISISELQSDASKVTDIIDGIQAEISAQNLRNSVDGKEKSDLFLQVMTDFINSAMDSGKKLKNDTEIMFKLLIDTISLFDRENDWSTDTSIETLPTGISPTLISSITEFFNIIYEFSNALAKADRENEARRQQEERRLKQQASQLATRRMSVGVDNKPSTPQKGHLVQNREAALPVSTTRTKLSCINENSAPKSDSTKDISTKNPEMNFPDSQKPELQAKNKNCHGDVNSEHGKQLMKSNNNDELSQNEMETEQLKNCSDRTFQLYNVKSPEKVTPLEKSKSLENVMEKDNNSYLSGKSKTSVNPPIILEDHKIRLDDNSQKLRFLTDLSGMNKVSGTNVMSPNANRNSESQLSSTKKPPRTPTPKLQKEQFAEAKKFGISRRILNDAPTNIASMKSSNLTTNEPKSLTRTFSVDDIRQQVAKKKLQVNAISETNTNEDICDNNSTPLSPEKNLSETDLTELPHNRF